MMIDKLEMLNHNNKITAYTIDNKENRYGKSKLINYMKKENTQEKVLKTTVTVSGMCSPF